MMLMMIRIAALDTDSNSDSSHPSESNDISGSNYNSHDGFGFLYFPSGLVYFMDWIYGLGPGMRL